MNNSTKLGSLNIKPHRPPGPYFPVPWSGPNLCTVIQKHCFPLWLYFCFHTNHSSPCLVPAQPNEALIIISIFQMGKPRLSEFGFNLSKVTKLIDRARIQILFGQISKLLLLTFLLIYPTHILAYWKLIISFDEMNLNSSKPMCSINNSFVTIWLP